VYLTLEIFSMIWRKATSFFAARHATQKDHERKYVRVKGSHETPMPFPKAQSRK
jgi:hypothetical protein